MSIYSHQIPFGVFDNEPKEIVWSNIQGKSSWDTAFDRGEVFEVPIKTYLRLGLQNTDVFARYRIRQKWGVKNPPPWLLAFEKGVPYIWVDRVPNYSSAAVQ
jgi:hypothetical protein